jgi:hypothetical protein
MKLHLRVVVLICMALLLSACFGKKTPQEVTEAFWEAVIDNDAKSAVKYSTLTDVQEYDGFSRDWSGLRPVLGKIVIDGEEASIVTELTGSDEAGDVPVKLVTHLVRQDDKWKVDYVRTREELSGGVLGNLLGGLNRLGKQITGKLSAASKDLRTRKEPFGKRQARAARSCDRSERK